MSGPTWVAFLIAAGIGAPARYLVDGWVLERTRGEYPWGTFVVNITGCLMLGLLTGAGLYHGLGVATRTAIGTGGLGAFTTFSTFSYETVRLAEEGATQDAVRYAVSSFVLGLAAASTGIALMAII